ncbi:hypothetical protein [Paenibacillus gansuensis]|uniref:Uncharacterized protein n=1 Tax=Paenibacillus gansuensis TaxID=306542 RepID=A0ABW5PHQ2_9BACL
MPLYNFREVWTPLRLLGIRFFQDDEQRWWLKIGSRTRRPLRRFWG